MFVIMGHILCTVRHWPSFLLFLVRMTESEQTVLALCYLGPAPVVSVFNLCFAVAESDLDVI